MLQQRNPPAQRITYKFRQAAFRLRKNCPQRITRLYITERLRLLPFEEIREQRDRCFAGFSACEICRMFNLPLQGNTREHILRTEIRRADPDKQRAVCILRITGKAAHTVCDNGFRLGRRGLYRAARAHAERIDAASLRRMCSDLIACRTECRMPCRLTVAEAVDLRLLMLNADTERKRLLRHRQPHIPQHRKDIARAVSDREDHMIGTQGLLRAVLHIFSRYDSAVRYGQSGAFCRKQHLAARLLDPLPQIRNADRQPIRSDMRLCLPENLLRRAAVCKGLQNLPDARILCAGIELAVRESTRAALPELHIAFRIEFAGQLILPDGLLPLRYTFSAFQQNRRKPGLRQNPRCEQSRRSRADHDRTVRQ